MSHQQQNYCLICSSDNSDESKYLKCQVNNDLGRKRGEQRLVSKQLHVIFILRKLLQVPSSLLSPYLKMDGGSNPDNWGVELCEECGEMVLKAENIFEEIMKARRKFKATQGQVLAKIRQSFELHGMSHSNRKEEERNKLRMEQIGVSVTEACRKFVINYDYGSVNDPFILGDLEAERALEQLESKRVNSDLCSDAQVKIEIAGEFDDLDGNLLEDSPIVRDNFEGPLSAQSDEDPDWEPLSPVDVQTCQEPLEKVNPKKPSRKARSGPKPPLNKWKRKMLTVEGAYLGSENKILFRCPVEGCGKELRNKRNYLNHKAVFHSGSPHPGSSVTCNECGGTYGSKLGLKLHLRSAHQIIPNVPLTADQIRSNRNRAKREKCPHCDLDFRKYNLKGHIEQVHKKAYQYNCELCGKRDRGPWEFKYHQAYAHHICSVKECKLTYGGRKELRDHQVECHGKEIDIFGCDECDKLFMKLRHLRKHKEIHEHQRSVKEAGGNIGGGAEGEGQFICDLCGKRFVIKEYLNYHVWHTHHKMRKKKGSRSGDGVDDEGMKTDST